jgi:hypothetical protein
MDEFIQFCKRVQPYTCSDAGKFFEGVVFFPYDDELLLQAYLFFNIKQFFPQCTELLLFEKAPDGSHTDEGKCDFVYLTSKNTILIIETKHIDLETSGDTAQTRRTKKRKKVFEQAIQLQKQFAERHRLPIEIVNCAVFTNDSLLTQRPEASMVPTGSTNLLTIEKWRLLERERLLSGIVGGGVKHTTH